MSSFWFLPLERDELLVLDEVLLLRDADVDLLPALLLPLVRDWD